MLKVFLQRFVPVALVLIGSGLVSSCHSTQPLPPLPEISFTRYQPISLDVANIDIIEEYKSPGREPNVEHLLPISPADAVRVWVKDRLRAAGANKSLQIIIKDASVVATDAPALNADGTLASNPNRRYDARLEVELRIYGTDAMSEANINVVATQTITLSEHANLEERKRAFYKMVFDLMESANAELEQQIFKYFPRYIMYAQTP